MYFEYSEEFQEQAAKELEQTDAPNLNQLIEDYGLTRESILKCQEVFNG